MAKPKRYHLTHRLPDRVFSDVYNTKVFAHCSLTCCCFAHSGFDSIGSLDIYKENKKYLVVSCFFPFLFFWTRKTFAQVRFHSTQQLVDERVVKKYVSKTWAVVIVKYGSKLVSQQKNFQCFFWIRVLNRKLVPTIY